MDEAKKEIKKEFKKNARAISILLISLIIINLNISIADHLNLGGNSRIKWTLDFGIYNALLSITFSIIYYLFISKKLFIKAVLLNKREENNEVTILGDQPGEIFLELTIKGKYQLVSNPIEIIFPHWIDVQCKGKPYMDIIDKGTVNKCLIHLDKLIIKKDNIDLVEVINIDLIGNSDEKNKELLVPQIKVPWKFKIFKLNFKNKGIKVKRK